MKKLIILGISMSLQVCFGSEEPTINNQPIYSAGQSIPQTITMNSSSDTDTENMKETSLRFKNNMDILKQRMESRNRKLRCIAALECLCCPCIAALTCCRPCYFIRE